LLEMKKMFAYYSENVDLPVIIGATKQDLPNAKSIDELTELLDIGNVMILPVDAREKEGSKMLALTLLGNALVDAQGSGDYDENDDYDDMF